MLIERGADPSSSDIFVAMGVSDSDMELDLDMGIDCKELNWGFLNNRGKKRKYDGD